MSRHPVDNAVVSETGLEGDRQWQVLIVNDGSDPRFDPVFDKVRSLGATNIEHHPNRGKGCALKRGFDYIAMHYPDHDVVCADSDGQHMPDDIFAIADELVPGDDRIVLGARSFTGDIPLRSRFGNAATRVALRAASGLRLQDTQTGLRGYPASLLPWLGTIDQQCRLWCLRWLNRAGSARPPVLV